MTLELTLRLSSPRITSLERAILETLAYSDVFDYPLRLDELHRYLTAPATPDELTAALLHLNGIIGTQASYYFLAGRDGIIKLRQERELISYPMSRRAIRYGRILGMLPFIRMIGLTGSLAVRNCDETGDLDYMIVAAHGRVWTARAFALLFNRLTKLAGNVLCPNLIVSEYALEWQQKDLYSARELCQMIPITGMDIYTRLRQANAWTKEFLPNADDRPFDVKGNHATANKMFEIPLRGKLGNRIEAWEMNRKIARFTRQNGFGAETTFNANICQGNFDHHGSQTRQLFQQRLAELGIENSFQECHPERSDIVLEKQGPQVCKP
ncbi:MAG: hypothetical protein M1282_17865 [Chloroflexi bacterium]|nr:hypothetical protein [Chloroflexota bacterium]